MSRTDSPPTRYSIRERIEVRHAREVVAEYRVADKAAMSHLELIALSIRVGSALCTLLEVAENLQAVADHAEDGAR